MNDSQELAVLVCRRFTETMFFGTVDLDHNAVLYHYIDASKAKPSETLFNPLNGLFVRMEFITFWPRSFTALPFEGSVAIIFAALLL